MSGRKMRIITKVNEENEELLQKKFGRREFVLEGGRI
jgi:hypothetical protein